MRVQTPEIAWHNGPTCKNDPIYSVSFHPTESLFATGGADSNAMLWQLKQPNLESLSDMKQPQDVTMIDVTEPESEHEKDGGMTKSHGITFVYTLSGHQKAINCLRFSPDGNYLATAGDDGLILWSLRNIKSSTDNSLDTATTWGSITSEKDITRAHLSTRSEEIYDVSWSPDSQFLAAGSIDNTTIIRSIPDGHIVATITKHTHYVQGVCWHPWDDLLGTMSCDRSASIHKVNLALRPQKGGKHRQNPIRRQPSPGECDSNIVSDRNLHSCAVTEGASTSAATSEAKTSSVVSSGPAAGDVAVSKVVAGVIEAECPCLQTIERRSYVRNSSESKGNTPVSTPSKDSSRGLPSEEEKAKSEGKGIEGEKAQDQSIEAMDIEDPHQPQSQQQQQPQPRVIRSHRLFLDETVPSFFRRLTWTPDGNVLFTPTGSFEQHHGAGLQNVTYGFLKKNLSTPAVYFPNGNKPSICVKCHPKIFKLQGKRENAYIPLPYRMILAIVTLDSVFLYDTEQRHPVAYLKGQHYAELTDIDWSHDGQALIITSLDGYCSLVRFDDQELGEKLPKEELPEPLVTALDMARQPREFPLVGVEKKSGKTSKKGSKSKGVAKGATTPATPFSPAVGKVKQDKGESSGQKGKESPSGTIVIIDDSDNEQGKSGKKPQRGPKAKVTTPSRKESYTPSIIHMLSARKKEKKMENKEVPRTSKDVAATLDFASEKASTENIAPNVVAPMSVDSAEPSPRQPKRITPVLVSSSSTASSSSVIPAAGNNTGESVPASLAGGKKRITPFLLSTSVAPSQGFQE